MWYLCKMGEYKLKYLILILACFLLLGCSSGNKQEFAYQKINSDEALEIMNESSNYEIIDVRTREEYAEGHIDGAFNIPYDEINELIEFPKDTILFVYCKSGARSKVAAETLISLGYEVYALKAYEDINLEE